jgi:hypothetical protein
MSNLTNTKEFFMLAVNKKGEIPTLKSAKVCACLFAGGIAELYSKKMISKDENGEFVSNNNFDENNIHLFPLYEVIKTANKPMNMQEIVHGYYKSCSGNKPAQLEATIRDMLVSRNAKTEIKAGFLRKKTNLVPKPEKVQAIISKIHTQLFGAEYLTTDTIYLAELLLKSTVANRHFSNDDIARLRIRLEELYASGTYAFEKQLIDCAFDTAKSFLEKMNWGDEEDDDLLVAMLILTIM